VEVGTEENGYTSESDVSDPEFETDDKKMGRAAI